MLLHLKKIQHWYQYIITAKVSIQIEFVQGFPQVMAGPLGNILQKRCTTVGRALEVADPGRSCLIFLPDY